MGGLLVSDLSGERVALSSAGAILRRGAAQTDTRVARAR